MKINDMAQDAQALDMQVIPLDCTSILVQALCIEIVRISFIWKKVIPHVKQACIKNIIFRYNNGIINNLLKENLVHHSCSLNN